MARWRRTPAAAFARAAALAAIFLPVAAQAQDGNASQVFGTAHAMERLIQAARTQRQAVFEKLSEKQSEAMRALFDQLDRNHDGTIQFEEFQGMTLQAWATFQLLSMDTISLQEGAAIFEELFKIAESLPQRILDATPQWFREGLGLGSRTGPGTWLCRYFGTILCLQAFLIVFERLRCHRWEMPSEPIPLESVQEASREAVLEYDTPWRRSVYEMTKILFMTLSGWAALRFVFSFASFALGVGLLNVAALKGDDTWRNFWLRLAQFATFSFLGGLGFYKVRVQGDLAPREECRLLLGNHIGSFELIALYGLAFPSFVSRSANTNLPLFNGIVVASDAVLVDRDDTDSRKTTADAIKERASDPNARHLMMFPEGTCNNQKSLFRFSRGAFSTGHNQIQLVCFKFPYRHFNPCWTGVASGGHEFWDLMWRSCCQFVQYVEVRFLPPHIPTDAQVADPTMFADHMQRVMAAHLGIKINSYTYKLYREAHTEYLEKLKQQKQQRFRRIVEKADRLRRSLSGGKLNCNHEKQG